ncbi:hypothetical protein PRIPAC_70059 [Pristionchus pacificus]|uniref:Uncharacterized protein n=1 Tax=Pristionchus pacificus TaxID=54126 RepID=A0A2A6CEV8_PRIPA|nr:hypothetical protein PRIPAC_70059 [Pristionchus pacificus]|eukprot:PDM76732.1 hypothetical protein PRIPAC_42127 [Pristionchus pacificus]
MIGKHDVMDYYVHLSSTRLDDIEISCDTKLFMMSISCLSARFTQETLTDKEEKVYMMSTLSLGAALQASHFGCNRGGELCGDTIYHAFQIRANSMPPITAEMRDRWWNNVFVEVAERIHLLNDEYELTDCKRR